MTSPPTMPPIQILPPTLADTSELLAFELANRAYFEAHINARPPDYYHFDAVLHSIEGFIKQRAQDIAYGYLIKLDGGIVGRVNLTGVARRYYNRASLGYRIGEQFGGKGIATQAVALAVAQAFGELGLWRIETMVRADNAGSIRVMEKNGFTVFGRANQSMLLHGVWHDLLHFERRSPHGPGSAFDHT